MIIKPTNYLPLPCRSLLSTPLYFIYISFSLVCIYWLTRLVAILLSYLREFPSSSYVHHKVGVCLCLRIYIMFTFISAYMYIRMYVSKLRVRLYNKAHRTINTQPTDICTGLRTVIYYAYR